MRKKKARAIDIELPDKFSGLFEPHRYKVFHGGRGGAKSRSFASALVMLAIQKPIRVLCGREFQRSISDSVHSLLDDEIKRSKVEDLLQVKRDIIEGKNGSRFMFAGMRHNIQSIKSKEGIDIAWIEEANTLSRESLDVLIPTIRKEGSEIWFSFNCDSEEDPVYHDFVVNEHPEALVVKVNYWDNPWFPEVLRKEMEWDKSHDTDKYLHVWEGEPKRASHAQVFAGRWRIQDFDTPDDAQFYYGADWGFSVDPTAIVRLFIHNKKLYIDREAYGVGVDIDKTPELFDTVMTDMAWFKAAMKDDPERKQDYIKRARQWAIVADSARPETISYMKRQGFNIRGAKKGKGSVEDGIEFLKSFDEIIVHPSCRHAKYELQYFSYKLDRLTGEPTPVIEDKHNHIIDAMRYALEPISRRKHNTRVMYNVEGI